MAVCVCVCVGGGGEYDTERNTVKPITDKRITSLISNVQFGCFRLFSASSRRSCPVERSHEADFSNRSAKSRRITVDTEFAQRAGESAQSPQANQLDYEELPMHLIPACFFFLAISINKVGTALQLPSSKTV